MFKSNQFLFLAVHLLRLVFARSTRSGTSAEPKGSDKMFIVRSPEPRKPPPRGALPSFNPLLRLYGES
ncbi:MAG: hypothetical protein ACR2QM_02265, partial [Longimicrobiales bacterium]